MQMPHEIPTSEKVGVIAGSGNLPAEVVKSSKILGRELFVIYLQSDSPEPEYLQHTKHIKLNIGSVGKAVKALQSEGIKYLVMAGSVKRPKLSKIRPDAGGMKLLARISAATLKGDNSLLLTVINFFEDSGFIVAGVDQLLKEVLMPEGPLGKHSPGKESLTDIAMGMEVARVIGNLDIGQGVVVQQGIVLGVEAIEGTDALLTRCAALAQEGHGGVLVKMKKPMQDTRIDLPTIGIDTVHNAHKAGLAGIAIEAGSALIVDKEKVTAVADKLGMFVVGV